MNEDDIGRCGGTGMVAYWDGSAYAGEMCRGCVDCEGPDEEPQSAAAVREDTESPLVTTRAKASSLSGGSERGEQA